jgi:outer membrane protein assembly factor BamB
MKDSKDIQKVPGGATVGVRASDGKLLWKVDDPGLKIAVIPTPIVAGDRVFVTSGYGAGCKLIKLSPDGNGGTKAEKVYAKKTVSNHHGGIVLVGDYLYGHSDVGNWECVELATGDEVWSTTKLRGKGSISYADGMLYCFSESGTLALIKATPEGWTESGRFDIPKVSPIRSKTSGKVWPHPVIADGRLYLRDYEYLYCYDVGQPRK